jgi:hypothetical protein
MKSRAGEYLGYNESNLELGAFFGVASGEQDRLPLWERVKRFASWAGGAALTAPSVAPVHMREHFRDHQPDQNLAA